MFILRKITGDGSETNIYLGDSYQVVRPKDPQFNMVKSIWGATDDRIYCFIVHTDGQGVIPLYKNQRFYVMLSSGATFANLTYKPC